MSTCASCLKNIQDCEPCLEIGNTAVVHINGKCNTCTIGNCRLPITNQSDNVMSGSNVCHVKCLSKLEKRWKAAHRSAPVNLGMSREAISNLINVI